MTLSHYSRRRWLVGAGSATLALPALDALRPRRARAAVLAPRLLIYYMPNGRRPEWWVPTGPDGGLTFPQSSSALQPFANRVLAFENVWNRAADRSPGAAHAMGTGTLTTGCRIETISNGVLENNISIDQLIVRECKPDTRFASLQWSSGEPGPCDVGGSSCAYLQSLSWKGPAAPMVPTISPTSAFERLFGSGVDGLEGVAAQTRRATKRSVIDFVYDDAVSLRSKLGAGDQETLDSYFDALRDLERELEVSTCPEAQEPPLPGLDYPGRVRAFHRLIQLAFRCDQTRVITFMIEFGLSGRSHDFLDAPGGHHSLSHYNNATNRERLRLVEQWYSGQLADLLTLLDGTPGLEGGTLLDETIVLALPSMGEGRTHDHRHNAPMLFGGTGFLNTRGRKITFPYDSPRTLNDLHVTLLEAYGVEGAFGTNTQIESIFGDDGRTSIEGAL